MNREQYRRLRTFALTLAHATEPDVVLENARRIAAIVEKMGRPSRAKTDAFYAPNYSDPIPGDEFAASNEGAKSDKVRVDDLDRRLQLAFTSDGSNIDKPVPDRAGIHGKPEAQPSEIAPRPLPDRAELHIGRDTAGDTAGEAPPVPVDLKSNTPAPVPHRRGLRFDPKVPPGPRVQAFYFRPLPTSTAGAPRRRDPVEDDAIARFIADKGISQCPSAMPGDGDLGELVFDHQSRKWRRNPPPVDTSPEQVD